MATNVGKKWRTMPLLNHLVSRGGPPVGTGRIRSAPPQLSGGFMPSMVSNLSTATMNTMMSGNTDNTQANRSLLLPQLSCPESQHTDNHRQSTTFGLTSQGAIKRTSGSSLRPSTVPHHLVSFEQPCQGQKWGLLTRRKMKILSLSEDQPEKLRRF